MNKRIIKILLILIFSLGIIVFLYPIVAQSINSKNQKQLIINYKKSINNETSIYENFINEAKIYNEKLSQLDFQYYDYKKLNNYNELLNINGDGMMGYIKIQKINVELPIYHTAKSNILRKYVGHLEGSSLPIGGPSTHAALAAHRGMASAKMFTDLNLLEIGDTFEIIIFDKVLTYQVDNITVVKPTDLENLKIENDKDYVTLITCTPYAVNTHRLLVRGTRIQEETLEKIVTNDAYKINNSFVVFYLTIPVLIIILFYIFYKVKKINKITLKQK
ncbi:MAG: class C sortase [Bacilli bacterium]|nr:class C sortase [Bacilli bacterium]